MTSTGTPSTTRPPRVLLTEGSGLTSRQVAGILRARGHEVGVVSSSRVALTRFAAGTTLRWHRVPPFGADPIAWLAATLEVAREHRYDVLFPTQEPVAALSWARRADPAPPGTPPWPDGLTSVVPPFGALRRVVDKVSATDTLARLGVPQPPTAVIRDGAAPTTWSHWPAYLKSPIGTASRAIRLVPEPAGLAAAVEELGAGPLVLQAGAAGRLLMVQSVFDQGRLVAFHACRREREGSGGGASTKVSVESPGLRAHVSRLGTALGWHGALSLDAIEPVGPERAGAAGPAGAARAADQRGSAASSEPLVIDVNPRLVEPVNALASGVDLVGAMLALARGESPQPQPPGRPGVRTHQLLLAVLGTAERGRGRTGLAVELARALAGRGPYRGSHEELTPLRDPLGAVPLAAAALATGLTPASYRWFAGGSVGGYALSPQGWATLTRD